MPDLHICDGGPKTYVRTMHRCPCCERLRPMAGFHQEWYGTTWCCLGCGDRFVDGERLPRPFAPGWRSRSATQGQVWWDKAEVA